MSETCKACRKKFDSGIWMSPQFRDERVLLFCSEKCKKEYLKIKLNRIKANYPRYYDKIVKGKTKDKIEFGIEKRKNKNKRLNNLQFFK